MMADEWDNARRLQQLLKQLKELGEIRRRAEEIRRIKQLKALEEVGRRAEDIGRVTAAQSYAAAANAHRRQEELMGALGQSSLDETRIALERVANSAGALARNSINETLLEQTRQAFAVATELNRAQQNSVSELLDRLNYVSWMELRSLSAERDHQRILAAATLALQSSPALHLRIDAALLAAEFEATLDEPRGGSTAEPATDLLVFAIELALAIASRIPKSNPQTILYAVVLPLIITLIGVGASAILTDRSNERLAQRIEAASSRPPERRHFISIRPLNIREIPQKKGKLVAKLPLGVALEELDRNGSWRYVRAIHERRSIEGWVFYQNLRPIASAGE